MCKTKQKKILKLYRTRDCMHSNKTDKNEKDATEI